MFVVPLNILVRSKEQDAEHFKTLISAASEAGANVGTLPKETNKGEFIAAWTEALKACPLKQVDVAPCLASVLAVKDANEIVRGHVLIVLWCWCSYVVLRRVVSCCRVVSYRLAHAHERLNSCCIELYCV